MSEQKIKDNIVVLRSAINIQREPTTAKMQKIADAALTLLEQLLIDINRIASK